MPKTCVICKREPIPGDLSRSFHKFPANSEQKQKWIEATGVRSVKKGSAVCSDHFGDDCYHQTDGYTKLRRLLSTAVPLLSRNYSVYKQMNNYVLIPCSAHKTIRETCLNINRYANSSLETSGNSHLSDVSNEVYNRTCIPQNLISTSICDIDHSYSKTNSETSIKDIGMNYTRNQSAVDGSISKTKFCFKDACRPSHISRQDFVSDEAWGRFVKLMRYQKRQITRNNLNCLRRGKQILKLNELVKSLRENKSVGAKHLETKRAVEIFNTNDASDKSLGNFKDITVKVEPICPDSDINGIIQDDIEIKTEVKEEYIM